MVDLKMSEKPCGPACLPAGRQAGLDGRIYETEEVANSELTDRSHGVGFGKLRKFPITEAD